MHRLGSRWVNWYFVVDGDRVTVVDAGVPGYWPQLEPALTEIGLGLDNVAALVLTHAHSDHTGVAGHLHERGVPVHLHAEDHELLRTGKEPWKREGSARGALKYFVRPRVLGFFGHMARNGAMKPPKIPDPISISDGDLLDVPGRPRVVHTPGHTPGHCVFHFEERGALLVGDLLCTWHPLSGRRGPQIMPASFNVSSEQCLGSLAKIERLNAEVVLSGHGEPWTGGAAEAAELARKAGPS